MSPNLRRALAVAAAVCGTLATASPAFAGRAEVSIGILDYIPATNGANDIAFIPDSVPGRVLVLDANEPVTAGAGCQATQVPNIVQCTGFDRVAVQPGGGFDRVDGGGLTVPMNIVDTSGGMDFTGGSANDFGSVTVDASNASVLRGGAGDDQLRASDGAQTLSGGAGNDALEAGSGDDVVDGSEGNDLLVDGGGVGSDQYDGGLGFDRVSYLGSATGVTVTVGEGATRNDGNATIGFDDVQDTVEAVSGTPDDDTLTGDIGPNTLAGFGGNDTLAGGMGNDFMGGGPPGQTSPVGEADVFEGGDQTDTVTYSFLGSVPNGVTVTVDGVANDGIGGVVEGDNVGTDVERVNGSNNGDSLTGNQANGTTLVGFGGLDTLTGGGAADFLDGGQDGAATGSNVLVCGGGTDTYRINSVATQPADCENGV